MAKTIGRYEIREELGRGGMAAVYLAYDPKLEREIALKLMDQQLSTDPTFVARFEREAKTVASLDHNAIVSLYDYGEAEGWLYLVMRYMKGGSLKELIARGPLTTRQVYGVVRRIGAALDKAHSTGVVHRDLKPANILLDGEQEAYLSDFGIVKVAQGDTQLLTETGQTLGTFAYMSPEQVMGQELDGRSDIYALGLILYEMLTGEHPYSGSATSSGAMAVAHTRQPVPDITETNPDAPAVLNEVIQKAMAKNRDDRYAAGREMTAAMYTALSGKPASVTKVATAAAAAAPHPAAPPLTTRPPTPTPTTQPPAEQPTAQQPVRQQGTPSPPAPLPTQQPVREKPTTPPPAAKQKRKIPVWLLAILGVVAVACIATAAIFGPDVIDGLGGEDPPIVERSTDEPPTEEPPTDEPPTDEPPTVEPPTVEPPTEEPPTEEPPTDEPPTVEPPTVEPPTVEPPTGGNVAPSTASLGDTWTRPADDMVMVYVPAGRFLMGSDQGGRDERPVHDVSLDAFWIDQTEVTNAQYNRCVADGDCERSQYANDGDFNGVDQPVVGVDWFGAEAYCAWAGGQLPTEAQWEYAARGEDDGPVYPWGDEVGGQFLNFCDTNCELDGKDDRYDDGYQRTAPVGKYPDGASWVGALDMAGNVWEWVSDWIDNDYYDDSPSQNPTGPASGRTRGMRGGSWDGDSQLARSSNRNGFTPPSRFHDHGFRCAAQIP